MTFHLGQGGRSDYEARTPNGLRPAGTLDYKDQRVERRLHQPQRRTVGERRLQFTSERFQVMNGLRSRVHDPVVKWSSEHILARCSECGPPSTY